MLDPYQFLPHHSPNNVMSDHFFNNSIQILCVCVRHGQDVLRRATKVATHARTRSICTTLVQTDPQTAIAWLECSCVVNEVFNQPPAWCQLAHRSSCICVNGLLSIFEDCTHITVFPAANNNHLDQAMCVTLSNYHYLILLGYP